jgi:hypothetical protein
MVTYNCECCKYLTEKKTDFNKHLKTKKHIINKTNNKDDIKLSLEQIKIEMEKLKETNNQLKETNNQNTNTIVKEARIIKKSLLSILNNNFKDTPSIEYIDEDDFITISSKI